MSSADAVGASLTGVTVSETVFESDFEDYEDHHFRRLDAKPGITGLWQVSGRSEVLNFEDVIYLDRQYIEQWSFWLDVSILFRTIPAVLRRTGAF